MKFFALVLMAVLTVQPAFATKYTLDKQHSKVSFSIKHLVISTVTGIFKDYDASFDYDDKKGVLTDVTAKIKVATIDTNEPKRDDHLKSKDFFEADKYPTIDFKSTKIENKGKKPSKVHGDLTMHGVTKNVILNVTYNGIIKDPWGNQKLGFEATTKVNRKDFGLNWNKALEAGGVMVGDEVTIQILGEALAATSEAKK